MDNRSALSTVSASTVSPEKVDIHYVCPISEVNDPPQKILRKGDSF